MTKSYGSLQRLGKNFEDWMETVVSESVAVYLVFWKLSVENFRRDMRLWAVVLYIGLWAYSPVYIHGRRK